jgi:hypothetical protein
MQFLAKLFVAGRNDMRDDVVETVVLETGGAVGRPGGSRGAWEFCPVAIALQVPVQDAACIRTDDRAAGKPSCGTTPSPYLEQDAT